MVASGGDIDDVSLMTTVVMVVNDGDSGCTNYHCITDYSQNLTTQTTHIYSLIVSVGQESEHGLAQCLWLQVSRKNTIKVLAWVAVSTMVSTGGESASKLTQRIVGRTHFLLGSWISLGVGLAGWSLATWASPEGRQLSSVQERSHIFL